MGRRQKDKERQVKEAIADYVRNYGVTTTRDIADYVNSQLGVRPSTATVAQVLHAMGAYNMPAEER